MRPQRPQKPKAAPPPVVVTRGRTLRGFCEKCHTDLPASRLTVARGKLVCWYCLEGKRRETP